MGHHYFSGPDWSCLDFLLRCHHHVVTRHGRVTVEKCGVTPHCLCCDSFTLRILTGKTEPNSSARHATKGKGGGFPYTYQKVEKNALILEKMSWLYPVSIKVLLENMVLRGYTIMNKIYETNFSSSFFLFFRSFFANIYKIFILGGRLSTRL